MTTQMPSFAQVTRINKQVARMAARDIIKNSARDGTGQGTRLLSTASFRVMCVASIKAAGPSVSVSTWASLHAAESTRASREGITTFLQQRGCPHFSGRLVPLAVPAPEHCGTASLSTETAFSGTDV
ncbi:hypothetical protein EYF80_037421 [Liparis tanakae]|uniref:Uncharacterized protein n=1 Tax=Liparis tanakae TaxID=230148 RepID=A0A4Z2GFU0_9TELE|nr:hypothetical protein EYF80_037421 [Liparis tanakae]